MPGPSRTARWRCPRCRRESSTGEVGHAPSCRPPRPATILVERARSARDSVAMLLRALDEGRSVMLNNEGLVVTDPRQESAQMVLDGRDVAVLRAFVEAGAVGERVVG